jgi:16S rRNA (uracil1498-N3)-methyltransferase
MAVPRIHTAQTLSEGMALELEEGPSRHLRGVLRLQVGAPVVLFNGNGGEYAAHIESVDRKRLQMRVDQHDAIERESPLPVHLGIGLSRGDRFDWVVQKATELGVTQISPLFSERVEVKLRGERAEKKLQHWQQVAISACEQCGRNRIPPVLPPQRLADWTTQLDATCKLVLHHRGQQSLAELAPPASVALLIGPEGGLSEQEIDLAQQQGFQPLTLGPRILRTETAPLASLAIVQQLWGDMA